MEDKEDLNVIICRQPQDYHCSPISISEISGVHWDNISGGVKRKQAGYSLYGYIDYNKAVQLVSCSGSHARYDNSAKVCIPRSENKSSPYKEGYKELKKKAGEKPKNSVRPPGTPPCTRRILHLLDGKPLITRGELRNLLCQEGYQVTTVRNAINALKNRAKYARKDPLSRLAKRYILYKL